MTQRVDLDAIAGELEEYEVVIGGKGYIAPADLSVPQLLEVQRMAGQKLDLENDPGGSLEMIGKFLSTIFGEQQGTELLEVCGIRRLSALIPALAKIYQLDDEGKAPGSSRASRRASGRSKPTSNGSIKSTSAKRASANGRSGARASHA